jgi:hypothetical protein
LADELLDDACSECIINIDIKAPQTGGKDPGVECLRLGGQQSLFRRAMLPLFADWLLRL